MKGEFSPSHNSRKHHAGRILIAILIIAGEVIRAAYVGK